MGEGTGPAAPLGHRWENRSEATSPQLPEPSPPETSQPDPGAVTVSPVGISRMRPPWVTQGLTVTGSLGEGAGRVGVGRADRTRAGEVGGCRTWTASRRQRRWRREAGSEPDGPAWASRLQPCTVTDLLMDTTQPASGSAAPWGQASTLGSLHLWGRHTETLAQGQPLEQVPWVPVEVWTDRLPWQ